MPCDATALAESARQASQRAYVPYSKFPVGAAVLDDRGQVYSAGNVENASYGLSICAERAAVFAAVAAGATRIEAVAIYTPTSSPATPCGACRQVMREFADDLQVVIACRAEGLTRYRLSELLPHAFHLEGS